MDVVGRLSMLSILALLCVTASGAPSSAAEKQLVVLTWADYIDPQVIAEFERLQHAKVKFMYFESDDDRDDLLTQNNGSGYDVVLADGISVTTYADVGWLAPIPQASIPNLKHIDRRWRSAFPRVRQYGVPYFWGTIGIAYRRDKVPTEFNSWMDLYRPQPALRGKILMIKHARDVIGMALKALGYSQNSGDPAQLAQARELLLAQKPFVRAYSYVSLSKESALVTGEVWAAMVFSGDSITLRELDPNIAFVIPKEGSNLGVDYFTIMKSSTNKALAAAFINFIHDPQRNARIARFVHYATPNLAAQRYLPSAYFKDPIIYPSQVTLKNFEFFAPLAPPAAKLRNEIFQTLLQ